MSTLSAFPVRLSVLLIALGGSAASDLTIDFDFSDLHFSKAEILEQFAAHDYVG